MEAILFFVSAFRHSFYVLHLEDSFRCADHIRNLDCQPRLDASFYSDIHFAHSDDWTKIDLDLLRVNIHVQKLTTSLTIK